MNSYPYFFIIFFLNFKKNRRDNKETLLRSFGDPDAEQKKEHAHLAPFVSVCTL